MHEAPHSLLQHLCIVRNPILQALLSSTAGADAGGEAGSPENGN
jgi:hypothetical protein